VFVNQTLSTALLYTLICPYDSQLPHGPHASTRNKAHHCLITRPNPSKATDQCRFPATKIIQDYHNRVY